MPTEVVVAGLGCGLAVSAGAAALQSRSSPNLALARAARLPSLMAAILLLVAAAVGWLHGLSTPPRASGLFLVAAVVVLPSSGGWRPSPASVALRTGAVLLLAGSGLVGAWSVAGVARDFVEASEPRALAVAGGLAAPVLAGLGIRHAVDASSLALSRNEAAVGLPLALYGSLAVVLGAASLTSLLTRGMVPSDSRLYVGLAAAFLGWSAVWLAGSENRLPYSGLAIGAALLLLWVALGSN